MNRRALLLGTVVLLPRVARAHSFPARRSLQVQAERDSVVLLASYAPPSSSSELTIAHASWGRDPKHAAKRLEAVLAAKALEPLTLVFDGKPFVATTVKSKLLEIAPEKHAVAVLLEARIDSASHVLEITASPDVRITFVDPPAARVTRKEQTLTWKPT